MCSGGENGHKGESSTCGKGTSQERTYQPASLVRGHCNPDLVERPLRQGSGNGGGGSGFSGVAGGLPAWLVSYSSRSARYLQQRTT